MEAAPSKAAANPYALHGSQGRLIVTLQRYGLLGWVLFTLLLLVFVALVLVSTLAPKPVVAVDANGRVLGTLEYLTAGARSTQEVEAAAATVAHTCLSLNADTIEDDVAECMNIMAEPLYNQWLALIKTGYVSRIRQAGARSSVSIDRDGIQLVSQRQLTTIVQVRGKLSTHLISGGASTSEEKPFALELTLTAVPRSSLATRGFRLDGYKDIE